MVTGCSPTPHSRAAPFFLRAQRLETQQRYGVAAAQYQQGLARDPGNAEAHYRLALLHDAYLEISPELAIHHYRQYLALSPSGRHAVMAQQSLETLRNTFIESIEEISPIPNNEMIVKIKTLETKVRRLEANNRELTASLRQYSSPSTLQPPAPPPPLLSSTKNQFHVVSSNDTLSAISKTYYGTTRHWSLLLDRNQSLLKGKDTNLRPGMRLLIPPLGKDGNPIPAPEPPAAG